MAGYVPFAESIYIRFASLTLHGRTFPITLRKAYPRPKQRKRENGNFNF
jgi:hypothetical protein